MSKKYWNFGNYSSDDDNASESSYFKNNRYKSSLGWSRGKLADTTTYYTSTGYYGYDYGGYFDNIKKYSRGAVDRLSFEDRKSIISLASRAYRAVRDMVVILDFPYQVNIRFSCYTKKYETGIEKKNIFIPTKILDDASTDENKKINIICGLGIHEASHLKYTNRRVILEGKKKYCDSKLLEPIINIVEDERIEDRLLTERPGYAEFIIESKEWTYNEFNKLAIVPISDDEKKLYYTIYLIRYSEKIENFSYLEDNKDIFENIKKILDPLPINSKETVQKSIEILETLKIKKENIRSEFLNYILGSTIKSIDPDNPTINEISSITGKYMSGLFEDNIVNELVDGNAEFGESASVYFRKEDGDGSVYKSLVDSISKYIPSIQKVLKGYDKNYDFVIHGCRNGLLDTTKLAEGYQGVQQVYLRQGHVKTDKTTLCVLIDESGSMGINNDISSCAFVTRLAAVLINESFKNLSGVDLYVYGHTADIRRDGETEILVYKEGDKYKNDFSFTNITGREQNRDGTAIYEVAKRVRKYTNSHTIMIILSDGEPCACNYYDDYAINDVRKNVALVEKMDFDIIQVSIQHVHCAKEMFDNVVCLYNDLANLPKELSQLIKKLVISDKKTVVS